MDWRIATALICCFGVFKDFRPSESYITAYLIAPEWKNLTMEQVNNEIYPVWAYSYLTTLVLVLLLTDFLRYKIVIVFEALSYISTWILLLWGYGIRLMQLMQFTFGCATSTEIAYYSYIYAATHESHYRRVSSFVRASSLAGRFIAALLAQLLLTFAGASFFVLNIISFANVCISFVIALMLPSIRNSFYFEVDSKTGKNSLKTLPSKENKQRDEEKMMISKDEIELTKLVEKSSNTEDSSKECDEKQSTISKDMTDGLGPCTAETKESLQKNEKDEDTYCVEQEKKLISTPGRDPTSKSDDLPKRAENVDLSDKHNQPLIKKSLNFFKKSRFQEKDPKSENSISITEGLQRMGLDFLAAYKDRKLLMWSIWWASTTCGKIHLGNYIQSLYEVIRVDHNTADNYNAAVDATSLAIC